MSARRGMELSLNTIVIAVIAVIILVILIMLVSNSAKKYVQTETSVTSCGSGILSTYTCIDQTTAEREGLRCLSTGCPKGKLCCPASREKDE